MFWKWKILFLYLTCCSWGPSPSLGVKALSVSSPSPLVFLKLPVLLPPGVAVTCYYYIDDYSLPLLFDHRCYVWLVHHHQFASPSLQVPQDLGSVILDHLQRCVPFGPWHFQPRLGTDVPVCHASHLVLVFPWGCACQQLAPCCNNVLDGITGLFSQSAPLSSWWRLSGSCWRPTRIHVWGIES